MRIIQQICIDKKKLINKVRHLMAKLLFSSTCLKALNLTKE